ncbi:hypothetical protein [Iodobacter ciconiae]|uniref:Uncharacterized protein n=1 Tax=Iodobacter ciconiae TaxID=2496266 RepID=A0A3S8ZNE9_9NEIS|nr:hypothetical protein [Iodobacter ciconiae]AZN35093.1 hypothetical protein EJO50_00470 [Iodobacter ciconiae]
MKAKLSDIIKTIDFMINDPGCKGFISIDSGKVHFQSEYLIKGIETLPTDLNNNKLYLPLPAKMI